MHNNTVQVEHSDVQIWHGKQRDSRMTGMNPNLFHTKLFVLICLFQKRLTHVFG